MSVQANLSLSNQFFRTYVLCVAALSLKMAFGAWHIAYRGYSSGGFGVRNPEGAVIHTCDVMDSQRQPSERLCATSLTMQCIHSYSSIDLKKGPLNPNPKEDQIKQFEPVERLRRMLAHEVENNVTFFIIGFLYILLGVGCDNAIKSYTYLSFAHSLAYLTHQRLEVRALLWVLMSMSFITISVQMVYFVLTYNDDGTEAKVMSHSSA